MRITGIGTRKLYFATVDTGRAIVEVPLDPMGYSTLQQLLGPGAVVSESVPQVGKTVTTKELTQQEEADAQDWMKALEENADVSEPQPLSEMPEDLLQKRMAQVGFEEADPGEVVDAAADEGDEGVASL